MSLIPYNSHNQSTIASNMILYITHHQINTIHPFLIRKTTSNKYYPPPDQPFRRRFNPNPQEQPLYIRGLVCIRPGWGLSGVSNPYSLRYMACMGVTACRDVCVCRHIVACSMYASLQFRIKNFSAQGRVRGWFDICRSWLCGRKYPV